MQLLLSPSVPSVANNNDGLAFNGVLQFMGRILLRKLRRYYFAGRQKACTPVSERELNIRRYPRETRISGSSAKSERSPSK